jgi:cell division protein FtsB
VRWWLGLLVVLLAGLQYRLWFAEGSLAERTRLREELEDQAQVNEALKERNAVLEREVLELQTGNSTVEQRAREQLGLVREDEVFFQIVPGGAEKVPAGSVPAADTSESEPGGVQRRDGER